MKRLIFGDSDPAFLARLESDLKSRSSDWSMTFHSSAEDVIRELSDQRVDIVVCRGPLQDANRAPLLQVVKERYPTTIRLLISDHTDVDTMLNSTRLCHQSVAGAAGSTGLMNVIDRVSHLSESLQNEPLTRVLAGVTTLPPLPKIEQQLREALRDPNVDLDLIAGIVESDPAIAIKILQTVNSSFFGLNREIANIREATMHLGVNAIRDLVLSCEVFRSFESLPTIPNFSLDSERRHAVVSAKIASALVTDIEDAAVANAAAMLQDVGKLVMVSSHSESMAGAIATAVGEERAMHVVEEEVFGFSHAEVGAYLLNLWGLPFGVVDAVAHHHQPSRVATDRQFGVLGAVHVADVLARRCAQENKADHPFDDAYLEQVGVADHVPAWEELGRQVAESVKQDA